MLNIIFQKAKAKDKNDVWVDSRWFFVRAGFQKDYKGVKVEDDEHFWDLFDEWKEEIYND